MMFIPRAPRASIEHMGLIPSFLDENDPRPAREQIHEGYRHGGGWRPSPGWSLTHDDCLRSRYPEDPLMRPIGELVFRRERLILCEGEWLVIVQPDRSFEVARVD